MGYLVSTRSVNGVSVAISAVHAVVLLAIIAYLLGQFSRSGRERSVLSRWSYSRVILQAHSAFLPVASFHDLPLESWRTHIR